ncbi:serine/threonine protein kinase [Candidatus Omnitrophota bacterium]
MKKLISTIVTLTITLQIPQQVSALRPMAEKLRKEGPKASSSGTITSVAVEEAIAELIGAHDFSDSMLTLDKMRLFLLEKRPDIFEGTPGEVRQKALIALAVRNRRIQREVFFVGPKGRWLTIMEDESTRFISEKIGFLLRRGSYKAPFIASDFNEEYRLIATGREFYRKDAFLKFFDTCIHAGKIEFGYQWEREYVARLRSMSARELQSEWNRLEILQERIAHFPLPILSFGEYASDTFGYASLFKIGQYQKGILTDPSLHDDVMRFIVFNIAMMNIFREWVRRHSCEGGPKDAPDPMKAKVNISAVDGMINSFNDLSKEPDHPVFKLVREVTDEYAVEVLEPPTKASSAGSEYAFRVYGQESRSHGLILEYLTQNRAFGRYTEKIDPRCGVVDIEVFKKDMETHFSQLVELGSRAKNAKVITYGGRRYLPAAWRDGKGGQICFAQIDKENDGLVLGSSGFSLCHGLAIRAKRDDVPYLLAAHLHNKDEYLIEFLLTNLIQHGFNDVKVLLGSRDRISDKCKAVVLGIDSDAKIIETFDDLRKEPSLVATNKYASFSNEIRTWQRRRPHVKANHGNFRPGSEKTKASSAGDGELDLRTREGLEEAYSILDDLWDELFCMQNDRYSDSDRRDRSEEYWGLADKILDFLSADDYAELFNIYDDPELQIELVRLLNLMEDIDHDLYTDFNSEASVMCDALSERARNMQEESFSEQHRNEMSDAETRGREMLALEVFCAQSELDEAMVFIVRAEPGAEVTLALQYDITNEEELVPIMREFPMTQITSSGIYAVRVPRWIGEHNVPVINPDKTRQYAFTFYVFDGENYYNTRGAYRPYKDAMPTVGTMTIPRLADLYHDGKDIPQALKEFDEVEADDIIGKFLQFCFFRAKVVKHLDDQNKIVDRDVILQEIEASGDRGDTIIAEGLQSWIDKNPIFIWPPPARSPDHAADDNDPPKIKPSSAGAAITFKVLTDALSTSLPFLTVGLVVAVLTYYLFYDVRLYVNAAKRYDKRKRWLDFAREKISYDLLHWPEKIKVLFGNRRPLKIGERVNGYMLIQKIGEGGQALVYRAKKDGRTIAIKVLDPKRNPKKKENSGGSDTAQGKKIDRKKFAKHVRSLIGEYELMLGMEHNNIVKVHNLYRVRDSWCLEMEFVEGIRGENRSPDLALLLKQGSDLDIEDKFKIFREAVEGLSYAHGREIIHGDIKPGNFLITKGKKLKIADFGYAIPVDDRPRFDKGGPGSKKRKIKLHGTPKYASPEQFLKDKIDFNSDIYSLGIVAYELFAGHHPFEDFFKEAKAVKKLEPEKLLKELEAGPANTPRELNPEIPEWLEEIILKCMEFEKGSRYENAVVLKYHLSKVVAEERRRQELAKVAKRMARGPHQQASAGANAQPPAGLARRDISPPIYLAINQAA